MKITLNWLTKKKACHEALNEFALKCVEIDSIVLLKKLVEADKLDWANWLIVRVMTYPQYVAYAIFAAEQVLPIFEAEYPTDKRPRQAIEAAKRCVATTSNVRVAAEVAEVAADAAADAATWVVADAAAWAARAAAEVAAAWAADAAVAAAWAAGAAAEAAAWAADAAEAAAGKSMKLKILSYGINLLEDKNAKK